VQCTCTLPTKQNEGYSEGCRRDSELKGHFAFTFAASWYHPTEEDIYFITGLSRRGEDFPQFPDVPVGVAAESQLMYSQ
jgi:hypothetical protein